MENVKQWVLRKEHILTQLNYTLLPGERAYIIGGSNVHENFWFIVSKENNLGNYSVIDKKVWNITHTQIRGRLIALGEVLPTITLMWVKNTVLSLNPLDPANNVVILTDNILEKRL